MRFGFHDFAELHVIALPPCYSFFSKINVLTTRVVQIPEWLVYGYTSSLIAASGTKLDTRKLSNILYGYGVVLRTRKLLARIRSGVSRIRGVTF